jgi:hypothetical protein
MAPPSDRLPWRLSSLGVAAALATGLACSGCAASVGHVADPPTYEALKTFITREHVGSVEQVVAALPPSYLEHHALMFETRSLQAASFERPRAIVYGTDASFVIAFDGQPADSGGALETMEFDRDTRRFVLREIAFEDGADGPRATFSDDNPAACKTCHGVPEHPIWDSYPTWPGAYGEVEGVPPWMAAREKDGYAAFLRVRDEDPRYRSLVVRDEGGVALDERRYHGSRQTSANAELGALLARWNAEAVVHQLIASPKIEQELLGALVDACGRPRSRDRRARCRRPVLGVPERARGDGGEAHGVDREPDAADRAARRALVADGAGEVPVPGGRRGRHFAGPLGAVAAGGRVRPAHLAGRAHERVPRPGRRA